jgi:uncharacterized membrane protein HdeD (DUF308 family)
MIWVFRTDSFGRGAWKFLVGVLTLLAGVFIVGHPLLASGVLTIVLASYLFMDGLVEIIVALTLEGSKGKGWLLAGGVLSVLLACLLFFPGAVFRRNRHRRPDGRQTDFHRIDGVAAGHHPA